MMVMFDNALGIAAGVISEHFGGQLPVPVHLVRDTSGTIVVVLRDDSLPEHDWAVLANVLHTSLEQYSPGARRVLLRESDLIDPDDILCSPDKVPALGVSGLFLIDRLLTNQDWLRKPLSTRPPLPTLVAFSVKGGVGRSTALAMFAWHLARQGKRVLVVDLDLEAPGIGSMLLDNLPTYGLVDWLTESLNGGADESLLAQCVASSPISRNTEGSVDVIPAYGADTGNYVAKLGRIYMPSASNDGRLIGLAERLQELLEAAVRLPSGPDVVLLDARAGLHDIGSAAVTRLGAEALLFARNDGQNWWAFGQLFEHLRNAKSVAQGMGHDDDLRWKLKMVAAQTEPRMEARRAWVQASYSVWNRFYDDESAAESDRFEPAVFDRDSSEAPHFPLFINFDSAVRSLILTTPDDEPDWPFIQGVFGEFFVGVEARLWPNARQQQMEEN